MESVYEIDYILTTERQAMFERLFPLPDRCGGLHDRRDRDVLRRLRGDPGLLPHRRRRCGAHGFHLPEQEGLLQLGAGVSER